MRPAHDRPVVVGIDVMSSNEPAIHWAVQEARGSKVALRVVHVYGSVLANPWAPVDFGENELELVRGGAEDLVAKSLGQVRVIAADLEVTGAAVEGDARRVLIAESEGASVTVLGSRHLAALGATLLGSVACGLVGRAHSPVVVVRRPAGDPAEGARVVVGIDGAEDAEEALAFAFEHASIHDVPLLAVMCWRPDALAAMRWREEPPPPVHADMWLAEAMAGWRERYPEVSVHTAVIRAHPVPGLVGEATAQHLLVVGSHGRHPFPDTLLGSVAQGVLHHASCSFAVIPQHKI